MRSDGALAQDASPEHLDRVLCQHCADLGPIENYNFGWSPNLIESSSSLVPMFYDFHWKTGRLHVVLMELLRKMPHQNSRLDRVLSDSDQHCVDLSPIKNYDFGWGPNFVLYQSSLVRTFQARQ